MSLVCVDLRLVEVIRANNPIRATGLAARVTAEDLTVRTSTGRSSHRVALSTTPRRHLNLGMAKARVMRPLADSASRVMERSGSDRGMVDPRIVVNPRAEARLRVTTTSKARLVRYASWLRVCGLTIVPRPR